jgi:hypothetical protein
MLTAVRTWNLKYFVTKKRLLRRQTARYSFWSSTRLQWIIKLLTWGLYHYNEYVFILTQRSDDNITLIRAAVSQDIQMRTSVVKARILMFYNKLNKEFPSGLQHHRFTLWTRSSSTIIFNKSIRAAKKTQHFTIIKITQLMLFRKINAVYSWD